VAKVERAIQVDRERDLIPDNLFSKSREPVPYLPYRKKYVFLISIVTLLIRPLCPKEINAFITRKIIKMENEELRPRSTATC
jgi:hypothetical protein